MARSFEYSMELITSNTVKDSHTPLPIAEEKKVGKKNSEC